MNKFEAWSVVHHHMIELDDERLKDAWMVLLTPDTPAPPTPLGRVQIGAARLAHYSAKTGLGEGLERPPLHSQAMERLIFYITEILNGLLDLYQFESTDNKEIES